MKRVATHQKQQAKISSVVHSSSLVDTASSEVVTDTAKKPRAHWQGDQRNSSHLREVADMIPAAVKESMELLGSQQELADVLRRHRQACDARIKHLEAILVGAKSPPADGECCGLDSQNAGCAAGVDQLTIDVSSLSQVEVELAAQRTGTAELATVLSNDIGLAAKPVGDAGPVMVSPQSSVSDQREI